jgi:ABC-type lipoprotein release transport system permease subunit
MSLRHLLLRNLLYHWRANLAVFLGVAVGTAVLTGALLVGDSLRGSLRDLALRQLGWVDHALIANRFIREDVANHLTVEKVCPAILLQGSASTDTPGHRVGKVTILGVDERFWEEPTDFPLWESARDEVVLNAALASALHVRKGDSVTLHFQKVTAVPRETLLGQRDTSKVMTTLSLKVADVFTEEGLGNSFNLSPSPAAPFNAFVPLRTLQDKLEQDAKQEKANLSLLHKVNAIFARGNTTRLNESLKHALLLEDWGLVLHDPESRTQALFDRLDRSPRDGKLTSREWRRHMATAVVQAMDTDHDKVLTRAEVLVYFQKERGYLSLESRQFLLEPAVADAALAAARDLHLTAAPTIVYLADSLASMGGHQTAYALVAALDPSSPQPLGPYLPPGVQQAKDDEIIVVQTEKPLLPVRPGDPIQMSYYDPDDQDLLLKKEFRLRGLLPLEGAAVNPDLTPDFPGITDQETLDKWDPPPQLHYDNRRIKKPDDEQFWDEYRTTPKAYITLQRGKELWGNSRFGQFTSIRLALASQGDLTQAADEFRRQLLAQLQPEQGGLVFSPVAENRLQASSGGTDFGLLFLCFSIFLIVAALLLVGLLFRLNLDRRASEIGLLLATGYRPGTVRGLLLVEGSVLAALGALVGLAGSLLYAWLMLEFLRAWWPGGLERSFLHLYSTPMSLVIGYFAAVVVSIGTIAWAVRILGKVAPRALLMGETADATASIGERRPVRWSRWVLGVAAMGGFICLALGSYVHGSEEQAMTFFSSGALLLTACLAAVWVWMRTSRHGLVHGHGIMALARLGIRNAARHPVRSLLTAGLLASATFLVVAVQSFYRTPGTDFLQSKDSASGGFALLAESDVPIYQDLDMEKGRDELNFPDDALRQLKDVRIFSFRVRAGDDASCLNLYQPRRPRLFGVPHSLVARGGFQFKDTEDRGSRTPWHLLEEPRSDGAIPVFGEANTVEWMLHSGLGKEIQVPSERGDLVKLRVVGLLQDSVFQGELLMSEANFLKLYPRQEGYQFFLIDAAQHPAEVNSLLEKVLANRGFQVTPTAQRLETFLAVENTYLFTFQALGGLGLVLGALGLAVVLLRSVWERRGELALLRALGFRHGALGWLVLTENTFLLILGLIIGAGTALVSVAPYLLGGAGEVAVVRLLGLLGSVLLVGLAAGGAAVLGTLRTPLLPALRRE